MVGDVFFLDSKNGNRYFGLFLCDIFDLNAQTQMLSPNAQMHKIFDRASRLLFVVPGTGHTETAAAAIALAHTLRKAGKNISVIRTKGEALPDFIINAERMVKKLEGDEHTVISVSTKDRPLKDMKYEKDEDVLRIILTPKKLPLRPQDVKFETVSRKTDAIVLFGVSDLGMINDLVEKHPSLFTETPLVNIDVSPGNEEFGHCNVVDIKATCVSELMTGFLHETYPKELDDSIASLLLAGIMLATRNFQNANVSPACLHMAGLLLEAGADRALVTKELYQTKSMSTLRLWGRVLARIQTDDKRKMIWSLLNESDFEKSEASEDDVPGVVEELLSSTPQGSSACIVYAVKDGTRAIVTGPKADQVCESYADSCQRKGGYAIVTLETSDPQTGQSILAKQLT